jgi:hypothetical protein
MIRPPAGRWWAGLGRAGAVSGTLALVACNALLGIDDASTSGPGDAGSAGSAGSTGSAAGAAGAPVEPPSCTVDANCVAPPTTPPSCATARCDVGRGVCVYEAVDGDRDTHATADCRAQNGAAIALGDDCDDGDPLLFPGQAAACSASPDGTPLSFPGGAPKGACRAGTRSCLPDGKAGPCEGAVAPGVEDCSTDQVDEDCDGSANNGCPCSPLGSTRACDEHPGLDGVGPCLAGSQTCGEGGWSACDGAVGPGADDCEADGPDLDCDGVRGNGATCARDVYVYVSTAAYSCSLTPPERPIIYLADQDDPVGVPAGFTLITQFKAFREGSGSKTAIFRCFSPTDNYYSTGYSACIGATEQRRLGYLSNLDGGEGWVAAAEFFGKDFGPTGVMRSDDALCCPDNCSVQTRFVLK